MQVSYFRSPLHGRHIGLLVRQAEGNVTGNRVIGEKDVLRDIANRTLPCTHITRANFLAVYQQAAGVRLQQAQDQVDSCSLAAAG